MKFQKAKEIYEKFLALENIDPTLVSIKCFFFCVSLQSLSLGNNNIISLLILDFCHMVPPGLYPIHEICKTVRKH